MIDRDPSIWGADAWRFMHTLGECFPDNPDTEHRTQMFAFLTSLQTLLPCSACRTHFTEFIKSTKLTGPESKPLLSGSSLRRWLDSAHKNANTHRDARLQAADIHATQRAPERAHRALGITRPASATSGVDGPPGAIGAATSDVDDIRELRTSVQKQRRLILAAVFGIVCVVAIACIIGSNRSSTRSR
jgi:hypothetical protein